MKRKVDSGKKYFYNKSLERALSILCSFDFERQELTVAELSSRLELPKSTAHRLVSTLVDYNFLQYDPDAQQYSLGLRVLTLGAVASNSMLLKRIVAPFLTKLHAKLDKTVSLAVLRNDEIIYVDRRENWRNPVISTMGTHRAAHFGMFGQLLMAYLPEEEVDRILRASPLVRYTRKSITDQAQFKRRLRAIREQGYVIDDGEVYDGITGIAAPVAGASGTVVGGIGVSLVTAAESADGVKKIIRELLDTTRFVSKHLKDESKADTP